MRERTTTVRVDEDGRLTLPKPLREELGFAGHAANVEIDVRFQPGLSDRQENYEAETEDVNG